MAVVVRIAVQSADQQAHDRVDELIGAAITRQGARPEGGMVHLACPSGDGFLIVDVEVGERLRRWWDVLLGPALAEVGPIAGEQEI